MTFAPGFSLGSYLPETIEIPENEEGFKQYLKTRLEEILRALNKKDIAAYDEIELLCGQQFYGATPQTKRFAFRRVYQFAGIAPGAVLNIVHGIVGIVQITRLYGIALTAVPDNRPIPYADTALVTNQISVLRNGINIVVTNGATAPAIVSGIVVIEYLKN